MGYEHHFPRGFIIKNIKMFEVGSVLNDTLCQMQPSAFCTLVNEKTMENQNTSAQPDDTEGP